MWRLKKVIGSSKILLLKLTGRKQPMTKTKDTTSFESKLLEFIAEEDPLMSML